MAYQNVIFQGMHEILATLIFVLNYDQQTFAHLMEQSRLK